MKISNTNDFVSNDLVSLGQENTHKLLSQGHNLTKIREIVNDAHLLVDSLINKAQEEAKPEINCRQGCSFCCYNQVAVTAPEVLVIADYLKAKLNKEELSELTIKITELDKQTAKLNSFERKKIRKACPLLVNNSCSVYEVRPLSCRGWNSLDVKDCEKAFSTDEDVEIKVFGTQLLISGSLFKGMNQGLHASGYKIESLELVSALKIALTKFNLTDKYLTGKRVFREASIKDKNT
jgi:Fe-S-cluster containining protein